MALVKNRYRPPPPARSTRRLFSDIYGGNLLVLLTVSLTERRLQLCDAVLLKSFPLELCTLSVQRFPSNSPGVPTLAPVPREVSGSPCRLLLAPLLQHGKPTACVALPVSPLLGAGFPRVLASLVAPAGVVDVSVWSAFHWSEQNCNFQAASQWLAKWKSLAVLLFASGNDLYYALDTDLVSLRSCTIWILDYVFLISSGKHCLCRRFHSDWISVERGVFIARWNIAHCVAGFIILFVNLKILKGNHGLDFDCRGHTTDVLSSRDT